MAYLALMNFLNIKLLNWIDLLIHFCRISIRFSELSICVIFFLKTISQLLRSVPFCQYVDVSLPSHLNRCVHLAHIIVLGKHCWETRNKFKIRRNPWLRSSSIAHTLVISSQIVNPLILNLSKYENKSTNNGVCFVIDKSLFDLNEITMGQEKVFLLFFGSFFFLFLLFPQHPTKCVFLFLFHPKRHPELFDKRNDNHHTHIKNEKVKYRKSCREWKCFLISFLFFQGLFLEVIASRGFSIVDFACLIHICIEWRSDYQYLLNDYFVLYKSFQFNNRF